jgi:uncharacterized membrane protein SpoIIM required for sporulation
MGRFRITSRHFATQLPGSSSIYLILPHGTQVKDDA